MYEKWHLLLKSQDCHLTVAAQLRLRLLIYKVVTWVQGVRAKVAAKANLLSYIGAPCCALRFFLNLIL